MSGTSMRERGITRKKATTPVRWMIWASKKKIPRSSSLFPQTDAPSHSSADAPPTHRQ
jgi:hypothetical protein